jgi:hypothetical protein
MDKGNFVGLLDADATADDTDDGSLDFHGTVLSSETYMMPTFFNPSSEPSSNQ